MLLSGQGSRSAADRFHHISKRCKLNCSSLSARALQVTSILCTIVTYLRQGSVMPSPSAPALLLLLPYQYGYVTPERRSSHSPVPQTFGIRLRSTPLPTKGSQDAISVYSAFVALHLIWSPELQPRFQTDLSCRRLLRQPHEDPYWCQQLAPRQRPIYWIKFQTSYWPGSPASLPSSRLVLHGKPFQDVLEFRMWPRLLSTRVWKRMCPLLTGCKNSRTRSLVGVSQTTKVWCASQPWKRPCHRRITYPDLW